MSIHQFLIIAMAGQLFASAALAKGTESFDASKVPTGKESRTSPDLSNWHKRLDDYLTRGLDGALRAHCAGRACRYKATLSFTVTRSGHILCPKVVAKQPSDVPDSVCLRPLDTLEIGRNPLLKLPESLGDEASIQKVFSFERDYGPLVSR